MTKLPALSDQSKPAESGKFGGLRRSVPARNLSVRVYRKYGTIEIEFGVSMPVEVESAEDEMRLWLKLYGEVMGMHDEWAENELPKIQPPKTAERTNGQGHNEPSVFAASRLIRTVTGGKVAYRIVTEPGTRYSKYGCIVDDQVANRYYLSDLLGGSDEMNFSSYAVEIVNGRVVAISEKRIQPS